MNRQRFWLIVCLALAAASAFAGRRDMNPDGVSYLDMATEGLINGYWSPGYPALLNPLLRFHPGPNWENPLVHLFNFAIFGLTLAAFRFFLKGLPTRPPAPVAYGLFLGFILAGVGVRLVTPDLCVAAIVFLAAGIVLRLSSVSTYIALGAVLAFGYYFKAAMFPIGLLLMGFLFGRRIWISFLTFAVIVLPLVFAISRHVGHPSISETGRLNYSWSVNDLPDEWWLTGQPARFGTPEHMPRKLMPQPLLIEFASPVPGTYPIHFDPSYWFAGLRTSFDWKQTGPILLGGVILLLILKRLRTTSLTLWCVTAILMYALVVIEKRYVGSFLVLLCVLFYLRFLNERIANWAPTVFAVAALAVALFQEFQVGLGTEIDESQTLAAALKNAGLHPGDRLAAVRKPYNCYFVRLAGMRVVALIPTGREYLAMTADQRHRLSDQLRDIDVKALLVPDQMESEDDEDAPHMYRILTVPLSTQAF